MFVSDAAGRFPFDFLPCSSEGNVFSLSMLPIILSLLARKDGTGFHFPSTVPSGSSESCMMEDGCQERLGVLLGPVYANDWRC